MVDASFLSSTDQGQHNAFDPPSEHHPSRVVDASILGSGPPVARELFREREQEHPAEAWDAEVGEFRPLRKATVAASALTGTITDPRTVI